MKKLAQTDFIRSDLIFIVIVVVLCLPAAALSNDVEQIVVGNFSAADKESKLPSGWEQLTFRKIKRHTHYRLVQMDETVVVKAESNGSASSIVRKIRIDPKKYSILTWNWKVANILEKGDAFKKEGDDFPARIYVTFEYDPEKISLWEKVKYETARLLYGVYPPLCSVTYVWGNVVEQGSVIPNAYSDRSVMIVVESGTERLNQWIEETRNIYDDYKAVFHEDPPMISGVAIMTDSDDTGESATAYYGDIVFRKKE